METTALGHQRTTEKVTDSGAHHVRGIVAGQPMTRYRRGACENCGAMSHKTRDCLERPRKKGARWTGEDIRPDEYIQEAALDFEGKRDRWAGYDASEYEQVVRAWEEAEREAKALNPNEKEASSSSNSDDDTESALSEDEDEEEEEDKYAEASDMPGQKVDLKTRMTVRNLRLREDTAKYLVDLKADAAQYDPKTRSMRRPVPAEGATTEGYHAFLGEGQAEGFVLSWEVAEDRLRAKNIQAQLAPDEQGEIIRRGPAKPVIVNPELERKYILGPEPDREKDD